MTRTLTLVAALAALSGGAALADDDCRVPAAEWQPREAVMKLAEQKQWSVREIDIDASTHSSKTVADIDASTVDVVITLCAEEVCPVFPRRVAKYHWPLTDPAKAGTLDAFRATRDELLARLRTLFKSD